MKFKLFCTVMIISASLSSCLSSSHNETSSGVIHSSSNDKILIINDTNYVEAEALKMLESFYHDYILLVANSINKDEVLSFRKKHCSTSFLIKIRNKNLDYDPFIKAQDANEEWLSSLKVSKTEKNLYQVQYLDGYSNELVIIILKVKFSGGNYRIVDILE